MNQSGDTQSRIRLLADQLLADRNEQGFWDGKLSSSALGVAVSVIAFHFYDPEGHHNEIGNGVRWLILHQNPDGGYGDSPESLSNISTSLLSYSALHVTRDRYSETGLAVQSLAAYLKTAGIDVNDRDIARHVLAHYQKDYTFSVPILATCALCGIPATDPFQPIPQLPFELALMPRGFYRFLKLNVVSYAIPALVAVGIAIYQNKKKGWLIKTIRRRSIPRVMALLEKIMPASGGFLEAIPLTAFVALSLIRSGYRDHPVVKAGIEFLRRTQRADGSWPIDVDLSTWVTALAVKSFRNQVGEYLDAGSRQALTQYFLSVQNRSVHPFNGSAAGGWGWTRFSGSVPDGDDTPGALLALLGLNPDPPDEVRHALLAGCNWLIGLQNADGGFPTFSKGWGRLPFDRSCADLTGHAILALAATVEKLGQGIPATSLRNYQSAIGKAANFLKKQQQADGSWLPLWFGNQFQPQQHNPVYGTARVTAYLTDTLNGASIPDIQRSVLSGMISRAQIYLINVQNADGSWGGDAGLPGTIEETALAVSALANSPDSRPYCIHGLMWLRQQEIPLKAAPIGLYFASLWYDEKLYPQVMYLEALTRFNNP